MDTPTTAKIVTRFAPSPTGLLHSGNYRTAIFSYLFARQHGGEFILRIEDTDRARSKPEYEQNILESLSWLGLDYDRFYRQSERLERHRFFLEKLIAEEKAYVSKEEAKDGSGAIKEIVRFKNPNKVISFNDLIRGTIEMDTTDLGDFVIAKNIHEPLFHLAVVVDDIEMGVTHIIRGEDHIPNTPRHILLYEALGATPPSYAHLPLVLNEDRTKLSKRKGAQPITYYRDHGYLPQAILNFLALVGWNDGTEDEIFTLHDLLERFDLARVHKAGAIFNTIKLNWINKEYIKRLSPEEQYAYIERYLPQTIKELSGYLPEVLMRAVPALIDHISYFGEISALAERGEIAYFFEDPAYSPPGLLWKDDKDPGHTRVHLAKVLEVLQKISSEDFTANTTKEALWGYATEAGKGSVLWPLRYALSGRDKSPDPFTLMGILGKEATVRRVNTACALLNNEQ